MRADRLEAAETTWVIVLDTGEELVESLTSFARERQVLGASVRAHAAIALADSRVLGGHVQSATVRPTCEIILTATPEPIRKKVDPESGLALIRR